jgi:hypothetical protein
VGEITFTYCGKCGLVLIHIEPTNVIIIASSNGMVGFKLAKEKASSNGMVGFKLAKEKASSNGMVGFC